MASAIDHQALERLKQAARCRAILKFWRQLEILDSRVCHRFTALTSGEKTTSSGWFSHDELILDLETYYTVAHELLDLLGRLLPKSEAGKLRKEPVYKRIAAIRNHLVRHAYEPKPGNDPYGGLSWHDDTGPSLKGGSPFGSHRDPGFFVNRNDLAALLDQYHATAYLLPEPPRRRLIQEARASGKTVRAVIGGKPLEFPMTPMTSGPAKPE